MDVLALVPMEYYFLANNSQPTTTSATFVDVNGSFIEAGNWTSGTDYLIIWQTDFNSGHANRLGKLKLIEQGTTPGLDDTKMFIESASTSSRNVYQWATITNFTSNTIPSNVGDWGYGFAVGAGGAAKTNWMAVLSLNLSNLTRNQDYFYNMVNDTTTALTNNAWNNTESARLTFTPTNAGDDWLIISSNQIQDVLFTDSTNVRINASGSVNALDPEIRVTAEDALDVFQYPLMRVYTLGASEQTFTNEFQTDGGACCQRLHNSLIALNLDSLNDHAFVYSNTNVNITSTTLDLATGSLGETLTFTPSDVDDYIIFGQAGGTEEVTSLNWRAMIEIDGITNPDEQESGQARRDAYAPMDITHWSQIALNTSLSTSSHVINTTFSSDNANNLLNGQLIFSFSLSTPDIIIPPVVPDPPENFTAVGVSQTQIDLEWDHNLLNGTDGFRIFREQPSGSGFTLLVNDTGNTSLFFNNTGLTCSLEYNYLVAALNVNGSSANSSAANDSTFLCTGQLRDPPQSISLIEFGVYGFVAYSTMLMMIISIIREANNTKASSILRIVFVIPGIICAGLLAGDYQAILFPTVDTIMTTEDSFGTVVETSFQNNYIELQNPVWITVHYFFMIVLSFFLLTQVMIFMTRKE